MSTFHISTAIRTARNWVVNHPEYFNEPPTTQEQKAKMLKAYDELEAKGYKVIPACENIKADGTCAGHDDEEKEVGE